MQENNAIIKPLSETDILPLTEIEHKSFSDPWSAKVIGDSLKVSNVKGFGVFLGEKLCGYFFAGFVPPEGELLNICVAEEYRRQGFAGKMLAYMETFLIQNEVDTVYLEVRSRNNPARTLYKSNGFTEVGLRKKYYGDDDAIIMVKKI